MKKQCPCGTEIDLAGLGSLAEFINLCDPCANKENEALDQKRQQELEDAARAHRERNASKIWEKIVPARYRQTDVNHVDFPKPVHQFAKSWMSGKVGNANSLPWLGIIGVSGKGKTRVMSQIVKRQIWNGPSVQWVNATQFQWCAQNQHDPIDGKKAKEFLKSFRRCDFLAFDDLGKQRWTDTVESHFWDLIEHRYANCLGMMWTSNSSLEDLKRMLTPDRAEAIVGRLAESSNIAEL